MAGYEDRKRTGRSVPCLLMVTLCGRILGPSNTAEVVSFRTADSDMWDTSLSVAPGDEGPPGQHIRAACRRMHRSSDVLT